MPIEQQQAIALVTSRVIALCATAILGAVAANFALTSQPAAVRRERRSLVATGTMIGFFAALTWLVSHRVGVLVPGSASVAVAITTAGLALVVCGTVVNLLGRLALGRNWANQATVYEHQTLVRSGVYHWLRHPLYASLIWLSVGVSVAWWNVAALAATLLVFLPAMRHRAALEEALLAERFPEYADYRAVTGCFWPRHRESQP
ncbi:MAG: hypothetical protein HZB16_01515 [Armatimonadetes bacterium]|nr:hypothetical protein [Armatimonadota bacterium]